MLDRLRFAVDDLRRRQLNALRVEFPAAFDGHQQRMSSTVLTGLTVFRELSRDAPHLAELMTELIALADQDSRFGFLNAIPEGPILSMARVLSLERGIFGGETRDVARLSLLIALLTSMLEGLRNEAPWMLRPVQDWLDLVMDPISWEAGPLAPPPDASGNAVVDMLVWITTEAIHNVIRQPGWQDDPFVRSQFALASRAAYRSALDLVSERITHRTTPSDDARARIRATSIDSAWAGSLCVFCVHGWPSTLDAEHLADLVRAMGALSRWIDDIVDAAVDLRADRWSMVLLEIHDIALQLLPQSVNEDPHLAIAELLNVPFVAERLADLGVERFQHVRDTLTTLKVDQADVLPVLADVATVSLTGRLPELLV